MTKKEMKELLKEECESYWNVFKVMRNEYGDGNVVTEIYRTRWATCNDIYRELFHEEPNDTF